MSHEPFQPEERLLVAFRDYRSARKHLLEAVGKPASNRDPFAELAERVAADALRGELCGSPVQKGYDLCLCDGSRVQVKYLANSGSGAWANEHTVRFPNDERVTKYALMIVQDIRPTHMLVFNRVGLADLYDKLKKRHQGRGEKLCFTRCSFQRILSAREQFEGSPKVRDLVF